MPMYRVSGYYNVTKYVDRFVEAKNKEDAERKARRNDYDDEVLNSEEELTDFQVEETEEI